MDAILFSNKCLGFDFQGAVFSAAALLTLRSFLAAALLTAASLLHNRLRRLCNLLRRLMQLRCGCLSFFAFFSDLSFLQLRCSRFAVFGISSAAFADPILNSFAVFGISSLRSLIPWAPLEVQALSPNSVAVWGLFVFKKTF